jgi:protein-S-isoprenylcysteine O-methyltransferase Ste14
MILVQTLVRQGNWLFRYRSFLPLLLLTGALLYTYFFPPPPFLGGWYPFLCLIPGLFGLFIRVLVVGYSPANTSGRNTGAGQVAEQLNATGCYGVIRHPLYLGNFLMWLSPLLLCGSLLITLLFIAVFWLYYERIMIAEEDFLSNKFGSVYTNWAKKIPAFVPRKLKWIKPPLSFSYRKVLRKEKNGIFALLLVFWLFISLQQSVAIGDFELHSGFWFWAMLASALLYGILKLLKYKSEILSDDRG